MARVTEELDEVMAANERRRYGMEVGDLLSRSPTSRHLGVDPEAALRDANAKFTRRFHYMLKPAPSADGTGMADAGLARLDGYWNEIRAAIKADASSLRFARQSAG